MAAYDQVSQLSGEREGRRVHFVICVDYGTTYTGVAWALADRDRDPQLSDVRVVQNWAGSDEINIDPKVKSQYTYSANDRGRWGSSIGDNAFVLQLTKLELERPKRPKALEVLDRTLAEAAQLAFKPDEDNIPWHLTKSPLQIVTAYLREVAKCVRDDMESQGEPAALARFPIDLVITHPVVWDDRAKNLTFRAVRAAFHHVFPEMVTNPGRISLATESEACARYTMKAALDRDAQRTHLRRGDCVIVVDGGGGTVDLAAYRVDGLSPFRVTEVGEPMGDLFGSTKIDEYFLQVFLKQRLSERDYKLLMDNGDHGGGSHVVYSPRQSAILKEFLTIKHNFAGPPPSGEEPDLFPLPLPEDIGHADGRDRGIRDGHLIITSTDLTKMFEQCVKGILTLIQKQLYEVEHDYNVSAIFLSGGFSRSPYLYKRVRQATEGLGFQLLREAGGSNDSWTAVCRGGALMGLGVDCTPPPTNIACPFHIGVVAAERFAPYEHNESQKYEDSFDKVARAKNNICWIVSKGDLVPADGGLMTRLKLVKKISRTGSQAGVVKVVTSTEEGPREPSRRFVELGEGEYSRPVLSLEYNLSDMRTHDPDTYNRMVRPPTGATFHRVILELEVNVTDRGCKVVLLCGRTEGRVEGRWGGGGTAGYRLAAGDIAFPVGTYA